MYWIWDAKKICNRNLQTEITISLCATYTFILHAATVKKEGRKRSFLKVTYFFYILHPYSSALRIKATNIRYVYCFWPIFHFIGYHSPRRSGRITGYKSDIHVCSSFHSVFISTSPISLPPGIMLRMHRSTTMNLEIVSLISKKHTEKLHWVRVK